MVTSSQAAEVPVGAPECKPRPYHIRLWLGHDIGPATWQLGPALAHDASQGMAGPARAIADRAEASDQGFPDDGPPGQAVRPG